MTQFVFFVSAIVALAGAVGVVALRNPFFNVLSLVCHLVALAILFLLLRAQFVAAAQVVVYAGAVMVLYVFVVAYIGGEEPGFNPLGPSLRPLAALFVGVVLVELCFALLGSGLQAIDSDGAPFDPGFGSPKQIGELLLTKFLLPFELASLLLLIAAVGAVVLARRRRGLGDEAGHPMISAMDVLRPAGTGTQAESVSGLPEADDQPVGTHPQATVRPEIAAGRGEPEREGGW
jgi:NADH:ubiquinone oxidoreductase subunit 6 (subunit J)